MEAAYTLPEIKIYRSPWKGFKLMLLCAPFVAFSLYDIIGQKHIEQTLLSWSSLLFFGLGIPFGLFLIFDRRPQIIINETGIYDRTAYHDFINWNTIEHAYWNTIYKQPFVCLIIKDEFRHLIKSKKRLQALNPFLGLSEVNIHLGNISGLQQEQLTAFIVAMKDAPVVDRSRLLKRHFEKIA
ncbi:hypothetical protein MUY27_04100 [Mucilaginibacter sp. RS28]|uniref:Uncharacterized protein n=1 Tax=Mucilaginibacter straminoryzae TaxID=2932774 RepID=A0A9X2BAK2_9SPHI|nr:STM3941 family protein [Mucilaginibacter straminoryzae]MCJ8208877.1 hypothetical protein [Mucilaginibacter straminoryzae]